MNAVCRDGGNGQERGALRHTKPHLGMIDGEARIEARFDIAFSHMNGTNAVAVTDARQRRFTRMIPADTFCLELL